MGSGCHVYESNHLRDELSQLLYIDFSLFANSKILLCLTKWSALSCPLGGACYIHLTKGTNAVFSGFSAFSVTATNFMNSITFVMNHLISYFDISICHCSNRTLCYHLFKFHGFNHGYFLGGPRYIHLTTRTNAVFSSFSACFGYGDLLYELNHFRDESSDFLFRHFYMLLFQSYSLLPLFRFHGFNHECFLDVTLFRFVTQKPIQ